MYDHFLEEMADAIAKELHIDNNDVLSILNRYWQDKIALRSPSRTQMRRPFCSRFSIISIQTWASVG
jgi:hypothetical protein